MKIARQRVYSVLQHPHAIFRSGANAIYRKQIQINAIKTTVTTGGMAERYLLPGLTPLIKFLRTKWLKEKISNNGPLTSTCLLWYVSMCTHMEIKYM